MALFNNALPEGFEFDGYRVERVLGAGAFGITYLVEELNIGRKMAVKEYLPSDIAMRARDGISVQPVRSTEADTYGYGLEKFIEEARTLVRFQHPNIVPFHRLVEANGTAYVVMEYQEGRTLGEILSSDGTLEEAQIRQLVLPLLDGLAEVHRQGFLHRDIKPDNIFVRDDGRPMLIDFGSAREALSRQSLELTAVLTPGYAPFEQYSSEAKQGPYTDIYAMGATLYRAAFGRRPPDSPTRETKDTLIPAAEAGAGRFDEATLAAIDAALVMQPGARPQTIGEWQQMLAGGTIVKEQQTETLPGIAAPGSQASAERPTPARFRKRKPRTSKKPIVIAILMLLAAVGGYWGYNAFNESEEASRTAEEKKTVAKTVGTTGEKQKVGDPPGGTKDNGKAEKARKAERQRRADEVRREAEIARKAKEALKAEEKRGADEARRKAEEARKGEDARRAEEAKRKAEEALRKAEEKRKAEEALRKAEEKQRAEEEGKKAKLFRPGRIFKDCDVCPKMVVIPSGAFLMGSPATEKDRESREGPQRRVTLGRFAMGQTEVTFAEWDTCVARGGCKHQPHDSGWGHGDRPVIDVSWNDAMEYVAWLSRETGQSYRLPSEAEWEYAARAGTQTRYWWGNEIGRNRAKCYSCSQWDRRKTALVAQFLANGFGLHDTAGNVWEWTADCYGGSYAGAPRDGSAVTTKDCKYRVIRGGGWINIPPVVRSASRSRLGPTGRSIVLGFRVARTLP